MKMRDILFRGKRLTTKRWAEGFLAKMWGQFHIINENTESMTYPIEPETICQFTGLTDKNGKKIWENDIVTCQTKYGADMGKVVFHKGKFCVFWDSKRSYLKNAHIEAYYDINSRTVVIGNVFDNPELLQEVPE